MNKFASLLMFFLGSSFILQAAQAESCVVGYYNVPNAPECEMITDEFGEEYEECTATGSAAYGAELDAGTPTLAEPDFLISDLDFTGDCDCTVRVYSEYGWKGCHVKTDVVSNQLIVVGGIWKRETNPRSFEVVCDF